MKVIGITGRSGCGKSSVTALLRQKGCPVIDGDELSRQILQPGSPCLPGLQKAFGADILDGEGRLKRRLLADRAFATPEGTKTLTDLTHPEIFRRLRADMARAEGEGAALYFIDGAVIIGTPFEGLCHKLVLVDVSTPVSVQRICARDGITPEMAQRRLSAQPSREFLTEKVDFVLPNEGSLDELARRVETLLGQLQKGGL